MTVDASALASILGITSLFVDLREGVAAVLPQQIAVLAQGNSDITYPSSKFRALSAGHVASRLGFGSMAHGAIDELLPSSGGGVGTIPVWVLPVQHDDEGVAADGGIVVTGTATKAASYRARIGGVRSEKFVIPVGAVDETAISRKLHAAILNVPKMPVRPTFDYDDVTVDWTRAAGTPSDGTIGTFTTTGQPKPGVWLIECTAEAADAGTFTVTDPDGVLVGTVTTMGAHTVAGLGFTLTDATEDFNVGDLATVTVPADGVLLTAKGTGTWTNGIGITIEIDGADPDESFGVDWTINEMAGGLVNPSAATALAQIGTQWATLVLNGFEIEDTDILDEINTHGEVRWGTTVHQPYVAFTGVNHSSYEDTIAVCSARTTDRINAQFTAPGSPDMPHVVAAAQLAKLAVVANNDPAVDYVGQPVTSLTPGADSVQWDWPTRDAALKSGSSTTERRGDIVYMQDTVTFYRPEEEQPPGYRFIVDIIRTQNVIYNLWLEFVKPSWAAAPLIPDSEPTAHASARKPRAAKAAVAKIVDALADKAIIVKRDVAKKSIQADIVGPRRLRVRVVTPYSGNTGVKDVIHEWGFNFGS